MPNYELILAGLLVTFTLIATSFFGWRQLILLAKPATTEEHEVLRRSAKRRLVVTALLIACALLIATPYVTGIAADVARIGHGTEVAPRPMTDEERTAARTYAMIWATIGLLLFIAVVVIAIDMAVIRRYWSKSFQRLRDDRREMLDRQLDRLKAERGYYHDDRN